MSVVIALVGRPNVGKSTLFNRLTRSRAALVADFPGLTRDRLYGVGQVGPVPYTVIDTGGLTPAVAKDAIELPMSEQAWLAIQESTIVFFMVDGRAGLSSEDHLVLERLRKYDKPMCLIVNKIDGVDRQQALVDFSNLGLSHIYFISSAHGMGVSSLMDEVLEPFVPPVDETLLEETEDAAENSEIPADQPTSKHASKKDDKTIKVAIVGRPNVGKSTLINRFLGEERTIVFDMPGTTRDSIYIPFERQNQPYILIDTAGIRRKSRTKETIEKFSIIKTLEAIDFADVVLLVCDGREELVDQDLHLLGYILDKGKGFVIVVNKWDGLDEEKKKLWKNQLDYRLGFAPEADIRFISALHGSGVGTLYDSIADAYASYTLQVPTSQLTQHLERAVAQNPPPAVSGRRIKLRYAHLGNHRPPSIIIHGNQTSKLPLHYRKYLENYFISALNLRGLALKIEFKTGENPYANKKNTLTPKQAKQRQRLVRNLKKKKR
jgi:GTPase